MTREWVDGQKIAAIGIRVQRWVTYHGLALNLSTDLAPFHCIVPCGISDRSVASVVSLTGDAMPADQLMQEYAVAVVEAFADVFNVGCLELAQEQEHMELDVAA